MAGRDDGGGCCPHLPEAWPCGHRACNRHASLCRPATFYEVEFCEQLSCCSAAWSVPSPAAVDAHMQQATCTATWQSSRHHPGLPAGMHHPRVPASVFHLQLLLHCTVHESSGLPCTVPGPRAGTLRCMRQEKRWPERQQTPRRPQAACKGGCPASAGVWLLRGPFKQRRPLEFRHLHAWPPPCSAAMEP